MNQAEIERILAPYPDMLTVGEVAAVLRVNPRSIQRWASQGQFAAVRAGRTYRIPRADVLRWMLAASTWREQDDQVVTRSDGYGE